MKAGTNMKIAGKTVCVSLLLTIAMAMRSAGKNGVSVTIGSNSQLACKLRPNLTVLTWKISPKVGGPCTLGYRADLNTTDRTNCSDSINWKFRPDLDAALEIRQVGIAQEGDYTCEIAATEGNYQERYYLTVLVHPRLSLYCDDRGTPVCEAAAGKPPAQVLWVVGSNSTPEEEGHKNGTVTVLSRFTEHSSNVINATCMVFHPAVNWSKSIVCHPSNNDISLLSVYIILCLLSIIILMAVIWFFKLHSDRLCHKTKPPEPSPTQSPQDDTMEVEPYTTYVQKENVIYNSVSDLTMGQSHPQGLWPAT